ncbi:MAG: hypothetical protein ACLQVG_16065 [Terriglobia bacterium]
MADTQVRIFPHNREEFPSEDLLRMWLLNGLRGRGGVYHFRSADVVKDFPPGSIALFRYRHEIIGEAVVQKKKVAQKEKVRMLSGEEAEYAAKITFAPSSIRLYAPPLPVNKIHQPGKNLLKFAGGYPVLDWKVYGHILEEIVKAGGFIS